MATPSSFGDGNGDNMNASLWGELQFFIDLSMIYTKLPLAPFFRLHQVCKEWNRLASDRQFLEQNFKPPISSNPYFIFKHPSGKQSFLISKGSSWTSMPVPRTRCEMSGLLFEDSNCNRIFDLHTRVFHTLPPLPTTMQEPCYPELTSTMMIVDTTQIPYGFKIIIADDIIGTKIYESNCGFWTLKPSKTEYCQFQYSTMCVHYNKSLYYKEDVGMFGWHNKINIYNLERDQWNCRNILGPHMRNALHYNIGVWQDRWFVFLQDYRLDLTVWESASNFEQPWTLFDSMPKDLHKWMQGSRDFKIRNIFCGEHVLVCNRYEYVKRAILYNLDRKTWDKIELPTIPMLQ